MRPSLARLAQFYKICFPIWTVFGLFFFTQGVTQKVFTGDPSPWWHHLAGWLIGAHIDALITPGIFWLSARLPLERRKWLGHASLHLVFSVCFAIVGLGIESIIFYALGLFPSLMKTLTISFVALLILSFHQNILTYWLLIGIEHALRYYRGYQERRQQALRLEVQASELKTQLMRAQLSALNMQLQPHFLFNTLNAIMVLVRQEKSLEAETMLARLSDLLRCVLEDVNSQEVSLAKELKYLRLYLSIEEVRFQDRLRVEVTAAPDVLDAAIPYMALQPIVENAVRHGICRSSSAGRIQIGASRHGSDLEIRIQDDGPGLIGSSSASGPGIGLSNTRARLQQLYGDRAHLTIGNAHPRGALVTVVLPFRILDSHCESEAVEEHAVHSADRR